VIVTDRSESAPCFEYADLTAVIDGRDNGGLISFVMENKEAENIVAVFTLTELVESVAAVTSATGLAGASLESAQICQDKVLFKKCMVASSVPTPQGFCVASYDEAQAALADFGGLAFIKPVVGFGGTGAMQVSSKKALEDYFKGRGQGRFLMEELALGSMHDVNAVFDANGDFHLLGCFDRFFHEDYPIEMGARYPSGLGGEMLAQLSYVTEQAARAVGIESGPVKADLVLTQDGVLILEMAPRLHGPKGTLHLTEIALGVSHLETTLQVLVTGDCPLKGIDGAPRKAAVYKALLPKPGRISEITGVEDAASLPGVEKVLLLKGVGDTIAEYRDSTGVPCYVFASGETNEDAVASIDAAAALIDFKMVR
jgi:biotin carboxylase